MSLLGEMDELVTFQRRTRTTDAQGGQPVSAWADIGTAWAKISGVRMGEGERHDGLRETFAYIFRVHTDTVIELSLTADDRIVWGGASYNIREVRKVPRRIRTTDIQAEAGVTE